MNKELETVNELVRKLAMLEERVKALEKAASIQGKLLKEQNVHIVHLKKKAKKSGTA